LTTVEDEEEEEEEEETLRFLEGVANVGAEFADMSRDFTIF
jgi:hypothetical protein